MRILGTKNRYPFSWLIRFITGEPISHIALEFDDSLVFHVTPTGYQVVWSEKFKKHNQIVSWVNVNLWDMDEEKVYKRILETRFNREYDFSGVIFIGLKRKLLDQDPKHNEWAARGRDFCIEILRAINWGDKQKEIDNLPLELMTPHEVIIKLKDIFGAPT